MKTLRGLGRFVGLLMLLASAPGAVQKNRLFLFKRDVMKKCKCRSLL